MQYSKGERVTLIPQLNVGTILDIKHYEEENEPYYLINWDCKFKGVPDHWNVSWPESMLAPEGDSLTMDFIIKLFEKRAATNSAFENITDTADEVKHLRNAIENIRSQEPLTENTLRMLIILSLSNKIDAEILIKTFRQLSNEQAENLINHYSLHKGI